MQSDGGQSVKTFECGKLCTVQTVCIEWNGQPNFDKNHF